VPLPTSVVAAAYATLGAALGVAPSPSLAALGVAPSRRYLLSKFKKSDEGFLLGYSSNSKAYRVFNKTHGIIEEAYDVEFDETNGSQDE
jgi:hypothetical protein